MSELTTPSSPMVFGVDVTTRGASLAVVLGSDPTPKRAFLPAASDDGLAHTPYSTWHRASDLATRTYDKLTRGGTIRPTLVLCAKNIWSDMKSDPSAYRRAMAWTLLLERLHRDRVPVGEYPIPSLLVWLEGTGHGGQGRGVMSVLDTAVEKRWGVTPLYGQSESGETFTYPYRRSTVALAMAAAMAVGIETDVPVTQRRLDVLSGYPDSDATSRSNKSINFPTRRKPPRTVAAWTELHDHPETLLRDVDKEAVRA